MKACGLVVEYNPFHNGHLHHLNEAKRLSGADCIIAVMSGSFLQRGEPAVIDKFHRTRAALLSGADLILELPFPYAVQSSELFAKGAVQTLHAAGADSLCFGSESGHTEGFIQAYTIRKEKAALYQEVFREQLNIGLSFPEANRKAYEAIGLAQGIVDFSKPNNILGYSYVREILDNALPMKPFTIPRTKSGYHDKEITGSIASATSIREKLLTSGMLTAEISQAIPEATVHELQHYKENAGLWHGWEPYFQLLQYKILTAEPETLKRFHGVEEGLEHRIIQTARKADSMDTWLRLIKTKRYTWTRIQRTFVHILAGTTKTAMDELRQNTAVSYIRVLGMNRTGRMYLNKTKKNISVPLLTRIHEMDNPVLRLEQNASRAYYSILEAGKRLRFFEQELKGPVIIE